MVTGVIRGAVYQFGPEADWGLVSPKRLIGLSPVPLSE
jgi:hypothetical protein